VVPPTWCISPPLAPQRAAAVDIPAHASVRTTAALNTFTWRRACSALHFHTFKMALVPGGTLRRGHKNLQHIMIDAVGRTSSSGAGEGSGAVPAALLVQRVLEFVRKDAMAFLETRMRATDVAKVRGGGTQGGCRGAAALQAPGDSGAAALAGGRCARAGAVVACSCATHNSARPFDPLPLPPCSCASCGC